MTLNRDLSGTRVMTAHISNSDMSNRVSATAAELDAVVEGALPSALTYREFIESNDGIRAVFTLEFSSVEDYVAKVEELLAAGDVDLEPAVTIEQLDSPFATGAYIDENFTSVELLTWLENPLVAAGIVQESERSDILSSGNTSVFIDGEEFQTGSAIFVDSAESQGFSGVSMKTRYNDGDDTWDRTFIFDMSSYDYRKVSADVDTYFSETVPTGGLLTQTDQDSASRQWELSYTGLSTAEVVDVTDGVFLSSDAAFGLEQDQGFDAEVAALQGTLADAASCVQICASQGTIVLDEITLPQGWMPASSTGNADAENTLTVDTSHYSGVPVLKFLEFDSIEATLKLSSSGGGTLEVSYALPTSEAEPNADLLAAVLVSGIPEGQATVSEGKELWVSTASIQEATMASLGQAIENYLPGSSAQFAEESSFFTHSSWGTMTLDLSSRVSAAPVAEGTTYAIATPLLSKLAPGNTYIEPVTTPGSDSAAIGFAVAMPTLGSFIFWAVLALIVLVGAALLFVFRDRIASASAKRREQNLAAGAATPSDPDVAIGGDFDVPQPDLPQPGVPQPDVPVWTEESFEVNETVVASTTEMRPTLPLPLPQMPPMPPSPSAGSGWNDPSEASGDSTPPRSGSERSGSLSATVERRAPLTDSTPGTTVSSPEAFPTDGDWEGELS